jgi:hypothetical protein
LSGRVGKARREAFEMWLRLSRTAGLTPHRLEEMVEEFEKGIEDVGLLDAPGQRGYIVGVDRAEGKLTAISLWETREDLEASDRAAAEARRARTERARVRRDPIVDRYEVVIQRQLQVD